MVGGSQQQEQGRWQRTSEELLAHNCGARGGHQLLCGLLSIPPLGNCHSPIPVFQVRLLTMELCPSLSSSGDHESFSGASVDGEGDSGTLFSLALLTVWMR